MELENDNFWAALAYARDAPDEAVAIRLGTLGFYFALADRVSEGRRFLELALSTVGEWRWMIHREDSPWYPTMRIFRQPRYGDWTPVFQRMADVLRQAMARRPSSAA